MTAKHSGDIAAIIVCLALDPILINARSASKMQIWQTLVPVSLGLYHQNEKYILVIVHNSVNPVLILILVRCELVMLP